MAGSFGFEAGEKYEVSIKAGERALLSTVRETSKARSSSLTASPAASRSRRAQIAKGSSPRR